MADPLDRARSALVAQRARDFASLMGGIDNSGAPLEVRAVVGMAQNPQDRLAALQQFFPDARPDPDDPSNFIFTNPETGKITRYNPRGLDRGDFTSLAGDAAVFTAGGIGAGLGAAATAPAGPIASTAGAAGGATVGTALAREGVNRIFQSASGVEPSTTIQDTAGEAALAGIGQGAGPVVAGIGRAGVKASTRGGTRRGDVQSAVDDMARAGAVPTVAQATQSRSFDALESALAKFPGGAGVIAKEARNTQAKIGQFVEKRAADVSGTTAKRLEPQLAGASIKRGIGEAAQRFRDRGKVLFDNLDNLIPDTTPVSLTNTRSAFDELTGAIPGAPNTSQAISNQSLGRLAQAVEDDLGLVQGVAGASALPYAAVAGLRRVIGNKLANPSLVDDFNRGELKKVYGALTADLREAAANQGPDALAEFDRATRFWDNGIQKIDDFLEPLEGKVTGEQIFRALDSSSRQGPTFLAQIRGQVSPEQWSVFTGTFLRRLGKATASQQDELGEVFSLETFLTNWNKLPDGTKKILFNGTNMKGLREDLDAISRAASRARDAGAAFKNPSGTSTGVAQTFGFLSGGSALAGLATGDATLLSMAALFGVSAVGANAAARLMTSERFVRWLAQSTTVKPAGFAGHLGRLSGIAVAEDEETRAAIGEFIKIFEGTDG